MITQIPNWQNLTDSEILVYLQETEWVPTNKQVLVADVVDAVGEDNSRLVIGTMQTAASQDPLMAAAYQAFTTVGISFSLAARQILIDQLAVAGSWPDEVTNTIKSLGGVHRPRWQAYGYEAEPTEPQLAAERQAVLVSEWTESKIQQVEAAMRLAAEVEGATIESVQAAAIVEIG